MPDGAFPGWTAELAEALARLSIPERARASGGRQGESRAATRGRAHEFADYRPYVPGDEPRLVDWRAYARFDRLYLKQHEEERARTMSILLDASASMDWGGSDFAPSPQPSPPLGERRPTGRGERDSHKGRAARRLAAALCWIAASHGETAVVWLLADGAARRLSPASSRAAAMATFRQLGAVAESGRAGLVDAVRQAIGSSTAGPTVLLSDLLEPSWPEALAAIAATREAALVQLLAPAEWSPPLGDEVELVDAESGEVVATRLGASEVSAYEARLAEFLAGVKRECGRLGIAYAALDSSASLRDIVFRQLPAAGILR